MYTPISVKASVILAAIRRAHKHSADWQAECCEIAMIPQIARRWQEANPNIPGLRMRRVEGKRYDGMTPQGRWDTIGGYVLWLGAQSWNSVCSDWYSHSASNAWRGADRETRMSLVIHDLRMAVASFRKGFYKMYETFAERPARYGLVVVDDLSKRGAAD